MKYGSLTQRGLFGLICIGGGLLVLFYINIEYLNIDMLVIQIPQNVTKPNQLHEVTNQLHARKPQSHDKFIHVQNYSRATMLQSHDIQIQSRDPKKQTRTQPRDVRNQTHGAKTQPRDYKTQRRDTKTQARDVRNQPRDKKIQPRDVKKQTRDVKTQPRDKKIQQELDETKKGERKKYLIYLCDNKRSCGGWGDRQRGIVTLYLLSLIYNRIFGIQMTSPCDIQKLLKPNKINWIIDRKDIFNKTTRYIDVMGKRLDDINLNGTEDVIYVKTNSPIYHYYAKQYPRIMPDYIRGLSGSTVFKNTWNTLMSPTKHLLKHVTDVMPSTNIRDSNSTLICAHIRIGKSKNLPNDPPRLNISSVPKVWDFIDSFHLLKHVFIATDNEEVRESAKNRFGHRYFGSDGKILHIDRQRWSKDACLGFETAIVDQTILTTCDILIVSPSGFSIRAAMLKDSKKHIYIFNGTDIKPFIP